MRTLPNDPALADLARLVRSAEEAAPDADAFAVALGRAVRDGWFRHLLSLGVGPETPVAIREGWASTRPAAISVVSHDPAEGIGLINETGVATLLSTFILSIAPAVVREAAGERVSLHDAGSIVPASLEPADAVVVRGLPPELGGRRGGLLQALEFAGPGAVLLVPDVAKAERPEVERWLAAVVAAGGTGELAKFGKRRLGLARLKPDRDQGPFGTGCTHPVVLSPQAKERG